MQNSRLIDALITRVNQPRATVYTRALDFLPCIMVIQAAECYCNARTSFAYFLGWCCILRKGKHLFIAHFSGLEDS